MKSLDARSLGGVLLAAAVLLACGSADDTSQPTDGTGGGAGAETAPELPPEAASLPACPPDTTVEPPHTDVTGIYSVPVTPELEPYAQYPVDSITFCRRGNLVELGYKLPELLVGKAERVGFAGVWDATSQTLMLTGSGTAMCEPVSASWSCLEHFQGIAVDLAGVAKAAEALPPAEAAGRIDVATVFGGDPIGILDFTP